jgi:uncharacterized membrane protein YeaQ/YmgE (transglycosylase-associated protein family)
MKTKTFIMLMFATLFSIAMSFSTSGQEESVAFDSKNKVFKLTPEVEKNIGLYSEECSFKEAELFKQNDSTYILEIHYLKDNKIYRERKNFTKLEVNNLRSKIDHLQVSNQASTEAMEGRGLLIASSLYTGLALYGPTLPIVFDKVSGTTQVGLYMLGAGAGFFVPFVFTLHNPISYGQANLAYYGNTRGLAQGALLSDILYSDKSTSKSVFLLGSLFSIGESIGGYELVKRLNVSNGQANLMTVYGDFGFFGGAAIANQLNLFNGNQSQGATSLILAGNIGGLIGGYFLGEGNSITAGDAEIISTTGWLGAYMPLGIINMIKPSKAWWYTTPSVLTGIAGAYIGHQLAKDYDFSFTQGYITKIGTLAGGLVGLGVTYMLVGNNNSDNGSAYLLGSYIGAQVSFLILNKININSLKSEKIGKFDFHLMPENFFLAKNFKSSNPREQDMFPLAKLTYKL